MAIISLGKIRRVIIFPLLMMCNSIFNTVMLELCAKEFQTVYNKINNNEPIKDLAINDFKTYHNFCAIFIIPLPESINVPSMSKNTAFSITFLPSIPFCVYYYITIKF